MNCTYYRPLATNIKEYGNIVGKLHLDLLSLTKESNARDVYRYCKKLAAEARPLKNDPKRLYWGLDRPETMPADARDEFFYKPTYLATALLMKAVILFPDIIEEPINKTKTIKDIISAALLGCTGRSFMGHGYDAIKGLLETLEIFKIADTGKFIEKYPDLCPEFTDLYKLKREEIMRRITEGAVKGVWGDDYTDLALKAV